MKTRTVVRVRRPFFIFLIAQQLPYFRFPYFYMGYLNITNKLEGIQYRAFTLFKNINKKHAHTHSKYSISAVAESTFFMTMTVALNVVWQANKWKLKTKVTLAC